MQLQSRMAGADCTFADGARDAALAMAFKRDGIAKPLAALALALATSESASRTFDSYNYALGFLDEAAKESSEYAAQGGIIDPVQLKELDLLRHLVDADAEIAGKEVSIDDANQKRCVAFKDLAAHPDLVTHLFLAPNDAGRRGFVQLINDWVCDSKGDKALAYRDTTNNLWRGYSKPALEGLKA
jgi:hypothetical protein